MSAILQTRSGWWRKSAALVAIALLALFAGIQVAHGHLPGGAEDSHCTFCLAAHSVAILIAVAATPLLVRLNEPRAAVALPCPRTGLKTIPCIRPPPAQC